AFKIQARTYDNAPVRTRAHVELLKWNYREPDKSTVAAQADTDTSADGTGRVELAIPSQGGTYRVRATARTPEGRTVETYTFLWIEGGQWDQSPGPNETVQIISDQKNYRAGDTAKLLIVAGKAGTPVYVSIEGRDIRQFKLMRSTDSTISFDVPIRAN